MSRALIKIVLIALAAACHKRVPPAPGAGPSAETRLPVSSANVFYFGHSLVGRDLPVMIGSFAKARGKTWTARGQIGWGTSLRAHAEWEGNFDKNAPLGFAQDSQGHGFFPGEGKAQIRTGTYDAMVITESNGHVRGNGDETVKHAARLVQLAREGNPAIRVFLYANWLDRREFPNDEAWRVKVESDLGWWERVADRINAKIEGAGIVVIPAGTILARVTREADGGKLPGLRADDFFRDDKSGKGGGKDSVHLNDRGFYVIALAHYASILRDSPVGLPVETETEDGPAEVLSPDNAARVQQIVWDVLKSYPRAGG